MSSTHFFFNVDFDYCKLFYIFTAEALALERSIFLHPMHIDLWLSLAEAYINIDLQEKIESNDGPLEGDAQSFFSNFDQRHLVSTCCIRAL